MSAVLLPLALLSGLLPACYVAAALPALWLTQKMALGKGATLLSAGGMDVTLVDAVIVVLLAKTLFSIVSRRQVAADRPLSIAIGAFFAVNLLATLAAGVKFGFSPMLRDAIALARLASEVAIVLIVAQSIVSLEQARRCVHIVLGTLVILAVIQFINFFGASHGIVIGEVQGIERGELRYFGPVGDSVGFVLLLGYVASLCFARPAGVFLFAGGIVLTAGIGAIFGTVVATALAVAFGLDTGAVRTFARRYLWLVPAVAFAGVLAAATVGRPMAKTLTDRVSSGKFLQSGGQRMDSMTMGMKMFVENPLSGVGFMGYAGAVERYGGARYFDLAKRDGGTANANTQWLQVLTDSGLPGLAAFIAVLVTATALLFRVSRRCEDPLLRIFFRAGGVWLLAQAFGNLAAVWLVPSSYIARLLWVMLGIAIAVGRQPQSRSAAA